MNIIKKPVDDYEAAFNAVEHLIKKGRKRIAHLAGPDSLVNSKLRLRGYLDALSKHKIPVDNELIISYDLSIEKVRIYVQHFLTLSPPPDALFCMNDPTAIAAMRVIRQNKLRIPQDISIIGFSNDLSSELVDPALTTVAQPTFDIGREAARLVLKEIIDEGNAGAGKSNHKTVVLKTSFIVRDST